MSAEHTPSKHQKAIAASRVANVLSGYTKTSGWYSNAYRRLNTELELKPDASIEDLVFVYLRYLRWNYSMDIVSEVSESVRTLLKPKRLNYKSYQVLLGRLDQKNLTLKVIFYNLIMMSAI